MIKWILCVSFMCALTLVGFLWHLSEEELF